MKRLLVVALLCCAAYGQQSWVTADQASITWPAQTAVGATSSVNIGRALPNRHTVQLNVTGSPATCTYRLEGSMDGVNFFDVSGTQTCTASVMFHVANKPLNMVRGFLISLSGGSVQAIYVGTH